MAFVRQRGRVATAAFAVFVAVAIGGAVASAASTSVFRAPAGYTGAEVKVPAAFPKPAGSPAAGCKVGFVSPSNAIPSVTALIAGMKTALKPTGCRLIVEDGMLSAPTQVTDVTTLLTQKVNGLIIFPLDPSSLGPSVAKAKASDVPIVEIENPFDATGSAGPGVTATVLLGHDMAAYALAQAVAKEKPGATFVTVGIDLPSIEWYVGRLKYWGQHLGLKYLGNVNTDPSGTPAADATAINGVLHRYHNVGVIMTYQDPVAQVAASLVRSSGSKTLVTGTNGQSSIVPLVKSGSVFASYEFNTLGVGEQSAIGVVDAIEHKKVAKIVAEPGLVLTKATVKQYVANAAG